MRERGKNEGWEQTILGPQREGIRRGKLTAQGPSVRP